MAALYSLNPIHASTRENWGEFQYPCAKPVQINFRNLPNSSRVCIGFVGVHAIFYIFLKYNDKYKLLFGINLPFPSQSCYPFLYSVER